MGIFDVSCLGFKANAVTYELSTSDSGHQKHELRRRLQSGTGPVWPSAARCCPVRLIVTPVFPVFLYNKRQNRRVTI